jgi:hypothetical protein
MGVHVGRHTVLRDLRREDCPPPATAPVVIGIDDWALARGHKYGTIVVDLATRCLSELAKGCDANSVIL